MKKAIKNYLTQLKENDKKGFSLVELIIVMAIMAILVGIVASQVLPYMEKSRQSKDQQQLSGLVTDVVSAIAQSPTAVADFGPTKVSSLTATDPWVVELGQIRSKDGSSATAPSAIESSIIGKLGSKLGKNSTSIYIQYSGGTVLAWPDQCGTTYAAAYAKCAKLTVESE